MKLAHAIVAAALAVALAGCPENPAKVQAQQYVDQLDPLLLENSVLAEQLLGAAAGLHDKKLAPESVPGRWERDVLPIAEHLHHQAALVRPPEDWDARHGELVTIWGERADAYRRLALAWGDADPVEWKAARSQSDDVKLKEEAWFRKANEDLGAHGLSVDQFP